MELPTYTSIWRIEKRLYKLYDFRLPMPLPVGQMAAFAAITVPYVLLLTLLGLPFNHTLFWLYVLPPGVLTWLATRPVLESKRLPELISSQLRYLGEPSSWCRMAPLAEKDEIVVYGRVWRRAEIPAASAGALAGAASEAAGVAAGAIAERQLAALPVAQPESVLSGGVPEPAWPGALPVAQPEPAWPGGVPEPAWPRGLAQSARPDGMPEPARFGGAPQWPSRRPAPLAGQPPPVSPARAKHAGGHGAGRAAPGRARSVAAPVWPDGAALGSAAALRPPPQAGMGAPANVEPGRPSGMDAARPAGVEPGRASGMDAAWPASVELARQPLHEPPWPPAPRPQLPEREPAAALRPAELPAQSQDQRPGPEAAQAGHPRPLDQPPLSGQRSPSGQPPPSRQAQMPQGVPPSGHGGSLEHEPAAARVQPPVPVVAIPAGAAMDGTAPAGGAMAGGAPAGGTSWGTTSDSTTSGGTTSGSTSPADTGPGGAGQAPVLRPRQPPPVERALSGPGARPATGWRSHVTVVPGGQGPGRPDLVKEARTRALLPLDRPHLIVVLGCTVGAGQTVTALMLADLLASLRGEPVAALDLNPGPASLTELAGLPATPVSALLAPRAATGQPAHAASRRGQETRGSRGRAARADVICDGPSAEGGAERSNRAGTQPGHGAGTQPGHGALSGRPGRLLEFLASRYRLTVADPGAASVARVLPAAGQLALVAPASPDAAQAVGMTLEWLGANGHGELSAGSVTVLNGVSQRSVRHAEQAELVARGRCRAIVRVPWDDHLAEPENERGIRESLAAGAPSRLERLRPPVLAAYTALAGVVVSSLAGAGPRGRAGR